MQGMIFGAGVQSAVNNILEPQSAQIELDLDKIPPDGLIGQH